MADISEPKRYDGLVVECHDCGFVYSSTHSNEDGTYDCPNCNEIELGAENKRLREVLNTTRDFLYDLKDGLNVGKLEIFYDIDKLYYRIKQQAELATNALEEGAEIDG